MSRPATIADLKSFTDLQEAIDEFKRYSDRSTSLYERTVTCFKDIIASVPTDKAEVVRSAIPFSKQEDVKKELEKSPSVFFIGEKNCGKSSIINELLRQSYLPVNENPCTARIVRIKYAEVSYARLVDLDGNEVKRELFQGKHLPERLIVVSDEDRENEKALEVTVEVGLNHKLLRSGIELIDSPGKNESDALDTVLNDFLQRGSVPLFVYVINGDTRLTCSDQETLKLLKDTFPQSRIMFVCNKVDITKAAQKYDQRSACRKESEKDVDNHGHNGDDDDDDDCEKEEKEATEKKTKDGVNGGNQSHLKEANKIASKGEAVYNQLKDKYGLGETWETCPLFHAISAKEVREERLAKRETEVTRRFRRFESSLQGHLGKIMKTQARRVVQKLLVLQETFANVVQQQRTSITQQASAVPQILKKAAGVRTKMINSLSAITFKSEETKWNILEDLDVLKAFILNEAEVYEVEGLQSLQQEYQTMVQIELPAYSDVLLNASLNIAFAKFVSDVKGSILEKTCHTLEKAVEVLMKDYVNDLTIAITELNAELRNPTASRMLEEIYDVQFLTAKAEADQRLEHVVNGLLDSMTEVAKISLRTEISEPLSRCLCPDDLSSYTSIDVRKRATRLNICETLLATVDFDGIVDSVREACTSRLLKMHDQFMDALSSFASLQAAFSNSHVSSQLEAFRVRFTPQIRKLTVEGMALQYLQIFGPVTLGQPIVKARHGVIYECTSERWCRTSPNGQCVVKVLHKKELGESVWNQTAVDLVNMVDIIEKLNGFHPNLLRLHGWFFPKPDILHIVMEKADKGLLRALQEGLPLDRRISIALGVAQGLKAIHDIDCIYEDLKPGNILLMSDGRAKINLAKPESPYAMTPLGAPFHISPEMYQFHGKGHLSYVSYDIYAFGMLLWVLCEGTGTARPKVYEQLETTKAMQKVVLEGITPKKLPVMNDACWELMTRCWDERETLTIDYVVARLELISGSCRK